MPRIGSSSFSGQSVAKLHIDASQFQKLAKALPSELNRQFNREFKNTLGAFMRKFDAQAFGKGKIEIRRKGTFKNKKGGVFIPKRSRTFGFSGAVHGQKKLDGKFGRVKNNAKHAASHEYGATITPKRGKFLAIPINTPRNSIAKARRAGVDIPRGEKPNFIHVKRVVIKPRLRFHSTFNSFRAEIRRRFGKALTRAVKATERRAVRAAAKKASKAGGKP